MCNALHENGIDVTLLSPRIEITDYKKYIKEIFGYDIKFKLSFYDRRFKNNLLQKYFGYRKIYKYLNEDNSEYVFTRIPNIVPKILKNKRKLIFEAHNNKLHERIKLINFFLKRVLLKNSLNPRFILFICISHNLKRFWKNYGVNDLKLIALHDGFDSKRFESPQSKDFYRKRLGIKSNKTLAVYTGSLYSNRKIESIITLAKKNNDVNFLIIGGPNKNLYHYKNLIKEKNIHNLSLIGRVKHSDIHFYLFAADILIAIWSKDVPTINYCSPLKLFEYMASGRNILSSDFITIREVLKNNKDAVLVNTENNDEINKGFKILKKDMHNFYGSNSRKKALEHYTWGKRAQQIIKNID
tara:strand:- start:1760 stop:2824 length:1065 start_codon:yes stop_codon:yes gene_type:complete